MGEILRGDIVLISATPLVTRAMGCVVACLFLLLLVVYILYFLTRLQVLFIPSKHYIIEKVRYNLTLFTFGIVHNN